MPRGRRGEPLFLVPWTVPAFAVAFIVIQLFMSLAPIAYVGWIYGHFALVPKRFLTTDPAPLGLAVANLLTYGFLHQGWLHVLVNVALLMAAAGPVNRNCGPVRLWILFAACVAGGGLVHVLVYWNTDVQVIGASGGAAGLIAAALRYRSRHLAQGEIVAPITRAPVSTFSIFWIGLNLAFFFWDTFGGGVVSGYATTAHIGGYLAGLFLAPVFVKGSRPRPREWPPRRLKH